MLVRPNDAWNELTVKSLESRKKPSFCRLKGVNYNKIESGPKTVGFHTKFEIGCRARIEILDEIFGQLPCSHLSTPVER